MTEREHELLGKKEGSVKITGAPKHVESLSFLQVAGGKALS